MLACSRAALAKIDRHLRTPAQFAAVAAARSPYRLQGARRWLALTACWSKEGSKDSACVQGPGPDLSMTSSESAQRCSATRLGLVVPKRWARRALDRNLVKRIAREAMHKAAPELDVAAKLGAHGTDSCTTRFDVVLRLKASLPPVHDLPRARLRTLLRDEADALLSALAREVKQAVSLAARASAPSTGLL